MSIDKLKQKFSTGAFVSDVKHYFSKINEIIDSLNSLVASSTPNYKIFKGLITSPGDGSLTITELENTFGVTISAVASLGDGVWSITASSPIFIQNKTYYSLTNQYYDGSTFVSINYATDSTLIVTSQTGGIGSDGIFLYTPIEIIVYN